MGYRLQMSAEIYDWLADLRDSDPPAAILVVRALATLADTGESLGLPLVALVGGQLRPDELPSALEWRRDGNVPAGAGWVGAPSHGCGFPPVRAAGTGTWRPGRHFLPGRPGPAPAQAGRGTGRPGPRQGADRDEVV